MGTKRRSRDGGKGKTTAFAGGGGSATASATAPTSGKSRRRGSLRIGLLWTWVLAVVLYFSWEAASYRGIYAYLAEWQFDHIGQDLPTFTFGVLTILFAWPALRLFRRRRRRRRSLSRNATAAQRAAHAAQAERRDYEAAIDASRDYMHFLFGFAAALALAATIAVVWTLFLPQYSAKGPEISITDTNPPEGPVRLSGTVDYGRIASFGRGILLFQRSELYAPVIPAGMKDMPVRYFVEFSPEERAEIRDGSSLQRRSGILVRSDLPGALVRLYRYLGYDIGTPYYVLYASPMTIRWPYYMIAVQFLIGAVVFLITGIFQHRHMKDRLDDFERVYGEGPYARV